ncbi:MAG: peptide deformylase [Clostridia bacterium]|nr:peptide deformylase [Clostridia bacterium]
MAIRNLRYEGDEILKKKSREIEVIDDRIKELAEDMFDTMHKYDGLGLAGVQVGILKRIIVIDLYDDVSKFCLINPVIVEKSKETVEIEEGCLSYPNQFGKVVRSVKVKVKALDLDGKKVTLEAEGLLAQALQHEIDHLEGETFKEKILPGTFEYITPDDGQDKK